MVQADVVQAFMWDAMEVLGEELDGSELPSGSEQGRNGLPESIAAERMRYLREAIAAGVYRVHSEQIAAGILSRVFPGAGPRPARAST